MTDMVFAATDDDGDTLTVRRLNSAFNALVFTVEGEDGHRSVILTSNQIDTLIGNLANEHKGETA